LAIFYTWTSLKVLSSIGRAAIRAYAAYNKDPVFLQFADEQWRFAKSYTISQADVSAGAIAVKNIKLQGACEGSKLIILFCTIQFSIHEI
jgi:hypothetical protein